MKKKLLAVLVLSAVMLFFSGSACNHEWQPWTMGETEMTRVCEICHREESAEIDREAYLLQQLPGHWDLYELAFPGYEATLAGMLDGIASYFRFYPDGTGEFYDQMQTTALQYHYEGFNSGSYFVTVTLMPEETAFMAIYTQEDGNLIVPTSDGTVLTYNRNWEFARYMPGSWVNSDDGKICVIELHEDRSFTAELDEVLTGMWHMCPIPSENGSARLLLLLEYEQNGAAVVKRFDVSGDFFSGQELEYAYICPSGTLDNFWKTDEAVLEKLKAAGENIGSDLVGQWTSTSVTSYANGRKETPAMDYSITFAGDGTFTASLDQERTGTWCFNGAERSGAAVHYKLVFDGDSEEVYARFEEYNSTLTICGLRNDIAYDVSFAQMDEAEKAARAAAAEEANTLIVGDWFSSVVVNWEDGLSAVNTGYAISFSPDGTFTANLEQRTSGSWSIGSMWFSGSGDVSYIFNLETDGTGTCFRAELFGGCLDVDDWPEEIKFGQYTDEDMKMVEAGPERITGTWSSSEGSLTVNSDGTYSTTLDWLSDGTWFFYGYSSESGWQYLFNTDSKRSYLYELLPDGSLNCWFTEGSKYYSTEMTKE